MNLVTDDRIGILVPPPALFAIGFAAGWAIDAAMDLSAGVRAPLVGGILALLGLGLAVWALRTFRRARTAWSPYGGSTTVVDEGPYAWSRNPMYLAMAIAYVGIAFTIGRVGPLLALPVVILWMDRVVIPREERYMEAKFGEAWKRYAARVSRWI